MPSPIPMGAPDDAAALLRPLALFADVTEAELEGFAARCDLATAHPGQVVQAQDVPVRRWHVIVSGHVVVQRNGEPIGLLTKGDSWSEHSLLNRTRSPIAVVALSPLLLLTLAEREFFDIPEHHPVLAARLVARSAVSPDRLAPPIYDALRPLHDRGV